MKKTLLAAFAALIMGGVNSAYGQSGVDLSALGWTKLTEMPSTPTDYYYVMTDKDNEQLMVGIAAGVNQKESGKNSYCPFYQTATNPSTDLSKVWAIENNTNKGAGYYSFRSAAQPQQVLQTVWNDARFCRTNDQQSNSTWSSWKIAYADSYFTVQNGNYPESGYWGAWEDVEPANDVEFAANKTGDKIRQFNIYAMPRTKFVSAYVDAKGVNADLTFIMINPNFESYSQLIDRYDYGWTYASGSFWTQDNNNLGTNSHYNETYAGNNTDAHGKKIENNFILPKGKYQVAARVASRGLKSKMYVGAQSKEFDSADLGDVFDASFDFSLNAALEGNQTFGLTAVSSKTGYTGGDGWLGIDNVTIKYLGKTIYTEAVALPATDMEAGQWYSFNIATDGDYQFTATTVSDVVYTANGDQDLASASTTEVSEKLTLTAGEYYFKSSSAQTMTIVPLVKSYTVGAATATSVADGAYIASLSTFTFTFGNALTNDDAATLGIVDDTKKATFTLDATSVEGTLTASGNEVTATFSGVTLQQGKAYTLTIPAGAFGYKSGEDVKATNEASSVTLNTGAIADGVVFLKDNASGRFLAGANDWSTQGTAFTLGMPFAIAIDANGKYTLANHMFAGKYMGDDNYTDNGTAAVYEFEAVEGGYNIKNVKKGYVNVGDNNYRLEFNTTAATVWSLLSPAEYDAVVAASKDAESKAVAEAMSIDNVTTLSELTTKLAADFNETDCTSSINNPNDPTKVDGWDKVDGRGWNADNIKSGSDDSWEVWNAAGGVKQTITGLPEGIYKVDVAATWRPGWSTDADNAPYARTTAYIFANANGVENMTKLIDWSTVSARINSRGGLKDNKDSYRNVVYAYVPKGGDLTIGICAPSWVSVAWMPFVDWKLTRYDQTEARMVITDAKYATFFAPFDVTIPSGVTASVVNEVDGSSLVLTDLSSTIPANTPVILQSESEYSAIVLGKSVDTPSTYTSNKLVGTLVDTPAPVGSYVLQKLDDVVCFYNVASGKQPTVGANRAYLNDPKSASVREFYTIGEGQATAIDAVKAQTESGDYYDLAGRKVNGAAKRGLYINNGKVILK